MEKVSIVIPVYNTDMRAFACCIESVENQTYRDFEVIVVDDGSSAPTANDIDKVCANFSNIQVYHEENKGVSEARNQGKKKSTGKYICYVDSDDYVSPFMLEKLVNTAEKENLDIVTSYLKPVHDNLFDFNSSADTDYEVMEGRRVYEYMSNVILQGFNTKMDDKGFISGGPCALIIRKELNDSIDFPAGVPYMEDVIWNYRVFHAANKIGIINETLYAYIQNESSATHTWKTKIATDRSRALNLLKSIISDSKEEQSYYALRVLSSYAMICKCCALTDELNTTKERIAWARKVYKEDSVWRIIEDKSVLRNWDSRQKIKRFLAVSGLLPLMYVIKEHK